MIVQAAPGLKCPIEGKPREYINDSEPVPVADTTYYRRLVDDGSLVLVTAGKSSAPKAAKSDGGAA
ncbi:MAG: hypothetical protein M0023_04465 [Desulfobacteraceae bacterium]|nr:hypothetical protein [Desulfobacteraceae bacterium]